MEELRFAGLIECSSSSNTNHAESMTGFDGFQIKKIMVKDKTGGRTVMGFYPDAELVQDSNSILNDHTIELVIVSAPSDKDLNLVAKALEAGKQVRVL